MISFNEIEKRIREFSEGYSFFSKEQKVVYSVHSSDLKELLRGIFSQWEGDCSEVGYVPNKGFEYKVKQGNKIGVYSELDNSSDKLTIFSQITAKQGGEFDITYATPPQEPQEPQLPQEPVSATPIGGWEPKGNYVSFKFQKDLRTGMRNFEKTVRKTEGGSVIENKEIWNQDPSNVQGKIGYIGEEEMEKKEGIGKLTDEEIRKLERSQQKQDYQAKKKEEKFKAKQEWVGKNTN